VAVNHDYEFGIFLADVAHLVPDPRVEMQGIAGFQPVDVIADDDLHIAFQHVDKLLTLVLVADALVVLLGVDSDFESLQVFVFRPGRQCRIGIVLGSFGERLDTSFQIGFLFPQQKTGVEFKCARYLQQRADRRDLFAGFDLFQVVDREAGFVCQPVEGNFLAIRAFFIRFPTGSSLSDFFLGIKPPL
jgi:hypothetical protein